MGFLGARSLVEGVMTLVFPVDLDLEVRLVIGWSNCYSLL
jgi:hypothetical protein